MSVCNVFLKAANTALAMPFSPNRTPSYTPSSHLVDQQWRASRAPKRHCNRHSNGHKTLASSQELLKARDANTCRLATLAGPSRIKLCRSSSLKDGSGVARVANSTLVTNHLPVGLVGVGFVSAGDTQEARRVGSVRLHAARVGLLAFQGGSARRRGRGTWGS
jgi:hypothetical protein